ncbi:nickel ABC transporter substrate-binding protein [Helicobacter ibis]|uniref:Nickel ABC transporter substrate-binding protein n=1 Tax=Helicobacter ibis TaxID=2962633 RepID=A0ABT4VHR4_9HELI|nr:nickel ABC transporter substrate-binding protein [Helicobacter ibis]MDA3969670.1 nickel ABC transporter substrate-binding protein [Helicobacter ibis]
MKHLALRNITKGIFIIIVSINLTPLYSKEIVGAWDTNIGHLNPHLYSPNQMYAQIMVYEPLVKYEDGKFVGGIAREWRISNDGKTYTFKIDNNLHFSNGNRLDSYAVEANFKAILENATRHSWLGLTDKIQSAKAIDENTFELKLSSPYIATLNELSLPRPFRIIDPSSMIDGSTKDGIKSPVGSGPWVLKESILGIKDVFVPNPYYHKKSEISQLTMKIIPDPNSRILALKSGGIDILVGKDMISRESFKILQKDTRYTLTQSIPQGTFNLVINSKTISDPNIRKAIILTINKDEIWDKILLQIDKKAENLFQRNLEFCDVELSKQEFNLQKSKEVLKNTNYKNKAIRLVYIANNPIQKSIAQSIQNEALKVGINIQLDSSEPIAFYQRQKNGDFDLIFNETWGNPFDPHSFISSMLIPSHADYAAQDGLENKDIIRGLIKSILNADNKDKIQKGYKSLLTLLNNSNIYIPLSYGVVLGVFNNKKIKSYKSGDMEYEFRFEDIKIR